MRTDPHEEIAELEKQLAAERRKQHHAANAISKLDEQLAAERERYERLWETSGRLSEEISQLNLRLTAERAKVKELEERLKK